jgi:hypothetical protein
LLGYWLFRRRIKTWHPDHWLVDPAAYLEGVDEGDFGTSAALKCWLDLFDQGCLETGYNQDHIRAKFITALSKYQ